MVLLELREIEPSVNRRQVVDVSHYLAHFLADSLMKPLRPTSSIAEYGRQLL
jgi:hypothetical protein